MFGRCALRLRQCIPFARKRGVLSRRGAAGSGSLVARHRQVHAPCEAKTRNVDIRRSAKRAHRSSVLGYQDARRKRLATRVSRMSAAKLAARIGATHEKARRGGICLCVNRREDQGTWGLAREDARESARNHTRGGP